MPPELDLERHRNESDNHPLFRIENIPSNLLTYPQWVLWRYIDRGAGRKPDKQPVNPHNLHNAGVHWANTWSTSEHAYASYLEHVGSDIDGIGFVLTKGDPFVGIDVDNCIHEGSIAPLAQQVVEQLQSYTEVSPSGHGLRILVACPEFTDNARTQSLEVYSHSRFLTLTGHHLQDTPDAISALEREHIQSLLPGRSPETPPSQQPSASRKDLHSDANVLWQRIFQHDQYGTQHLRRFNGDLSLDRGDHSYAVIRLLNAAARWTEGDPEKMREMMLMSPLANEKWLSKRGKVDWLDHQIADAIRFTKKGK